MTSLKFIVSSVDLAVLSFCHGSEYIVAILIVSP
jgi:hypothetical protein